MRNKRILIVDAREDARRELRTRMEATGHEVEVVHEAALAETMLLYFWPDLILVDLESMPDGGPEICAHVRTDPDLDNVHLVVVAAERSASRFTAIWSYPAEIHFAPPEASDRLVELVDGLLVEREEEHE